MAFHKDRYWAHSYLASILTISLDWNLTIIFLLLLTILSYWGTPGPPMHIDLQNIVQWSHENHFSINTGKSECVHFGGNNPLVDYSINNEIIPVVKSFRDLDLLVDNDLKFSSHREYAISKALRATGFLFKCIHSADVGVFVMLFKMYVIPILSSILFRYLFKPRLTFHEVDRKSTKVFHT